MSHSATLPDPDLALTFVVNGKQEEVRVPVQATLLDVLRERLHLTGTKKGCDHGQCGACTVHVNGQTHLIRTPIRSTIIIASNRHP